MQAVYVVTTKIIESLTIQALEIGFALKYDWYILFYNLTLRFAFYKRIASCFLGLFFPYGHWFHKLDFSPLCIFKCFIKSPAWEEA